MTRLAHEPDPAAGAWIGPRLEPFGTSIGSVIPLGFEAYARVLHPIELRQGRLARWADVAAATERAVHPLAQFWRLTGRASVHDRGSSAWDRGEPRIGELQNDALRALLDVLAAHSPDRADTECIAALWEGWGWVQGGGSVAILSSSSEAPPGALPTSVALGPEVLDALRLNLPGRSYLLFRGPLSAIPSLGHQVTDEWFVPQSPNLLWPVDRSWCVATEIDFDSTLVGGSAELIAAVLANPDLEAFPVRPDDSLQADADTVN
jgi:hypothetical protein